MSRVIMAGLSREALVLARRLGHEVVVVSDPAAAADSWRGIPLVTTDAEACDMADAEGVVIAVDIPKVRAKVQAYYRSRGYAAVDLLSRQPGEGTVWGNGLFVQDLANVSVDCQLGEGVRLNTAANVMHDVVLGDYVTVAPNAVVLGRVQVGAYAYIGANATVMTGIVVGQNCMIGAGAVVTRNVADGAVVKGVPARA